MANTGAIAVGSGLFGEPSLPTLMSRVECEGTEVELLECPHTAVMQNRCGRFQDSGIVCQLFGE